MKKGFTLVELLVIGGILFSIAVIVGGTWPWGFNPNYSRGSRVGYISKWSYKGFVWKGWVGELQIGQGDVVSSQQPFYFTINEEWQKENIEKALDGGEKVKLAYRQWMIKPWWVKSSSVVENVIFLGN